MADRIRMNRAARAGLASGIALLALGALGMVAWPPAAASPQPSMLELEGDGLPVCFWSDRGPVCVERAVGLDAESLLEALLAGPTPQEQAQGLWSAIPAGTTLDGVEVRADGTIVVRLEVEPRTLFDLDHGTFEIVVHQVGATLDPLGWRDLRIQARDPLSGSFVPLAVFLPPVDTPRKEAAVGEAGIAAAAGVGQPPAPGQGQPQGALSGKTVYVSAGHGWEWENGAWRVQRIPYPRPPYVGPIIEDHNNAEVVNQYLLQYLWNAGATVIPVRERDMNPAEVVVDNDAPGPGAGYWEAGAWATSSLKGYLGLTYRYTTTVADAATAAAVWTATLPADGSYAVYAWYRPGSNRAPDARYTIHHAGGETVVTVDQRVHGLTWRYLGSYGFRGGEEARVTLDNHSSTSGAVVIADAVRFGGGAFDDLAGIETAALYAPHEPWWEVATFYYAQRMGMSQPPDDVVARPLYARWEHAGTGEDAVYISWHTNGISGYQWSYSGTETYAHNGEGLPRTEGSLELRHALQAEMVQDIRAGWDPAWVDRGEKLKNLGELRLLWDAEPTARMPGALIEIGFHDNPYDTDALKEPAFGLLTARAMLQGIVKYFEQRDGIDLALLPEPPTHLRVENVGGGRVRVAWLPSPTDTLDLVGDAASGYRVYTSTDGLGWSNGAAVTGTTACTLTGLADGQILFVRVSATNAGGESFPTEVLGARVGDEVKVLLVNGFDRLNRTMLVPDTYPPTGDTHLRMFLDQMNRYDYGVQHGEAISYPFDSASNEALQEGLVALGSYQLVDWILGEESVPDQTLDATERALLERFLDGGGALFISGAEIGYHLEGAGADPGFYNGTLRAAYVGDDAGTYEVAPTAGGIFDGLGAFRFDAPGMYDADYPDRIAPVNGSVAALAYQGGAGGTAAVVYEDGCRRLVVLGFPFETIWPEKRAVVMGRVLDFLDECLTSVNTAIALPLDGSAHGAAPAFQGTAVSPGIDPPARVDVQVRRADGTYWTGSAWQAGAIWVTAAGTGTWSYSLPALADGDHTLRAMAWTTGGYSDTTPAAITFTYDTISPAATALITPTGGITLVAVGVDLAWEGRPDEGSPVAYLLEMDGQAYTTTQTTMTISPIAAGPHAWRVQVFDAAGNRSAWADGAFSVDQHHVHLPVLMRGFAPPPPACTDVVVNGGFETDEGWLTNRVTFNTAAPYVHSGLRSAQVGVLPGQAGGGAATFSSVRQSIALPAGTSATLRLWIYPLSEGGDAGDYFYISLYDQAGVYHALETWRSDERTWVYREYDLSAILGQQITLYVGAKNDGDDDTAALVVDDVVLEVCP